MEQPNGNQKNNMGMHSNPNVGLSRWSDSMNYEQNIVYPPEGEYPVGYRFCPTDEELVNDYLMKKILKQTLDRNFIKEVNIYSFGPQQLSQDHKIEGEEMMYFFTPRDRKYPNGTRPSRSAGNGYWKATGADFLIGNKNYPMGYRKSLVFYEGTSKQSTKTNWIMHEYRIDQKGTPPTSRATHDMMRLDDWVLCKIYEKKPKNIDPPEELPNLVPQPQSNHDLPLLNGSHPPPMNNTNISTMSNCNGQTNAYDCGDHIYNQDLSTGLVHGLTTQPLFMDDEMLESANLDMTVRQDFPMDSSHQFEVPNLPDYDFSVGGCEEDYVSVDSLLMDYPEPVSCVPGDQAQPVPSVPADKVHQFKL